MDNGVELLEELREASREACASTNNEKFQRVFRALESYADLALEYVIDRERREVTQASASVPTPTEPQPS